MKTFAHLELWAEAELADFLQVWHFRFLRLLHLSLVVTQQMAVLVSPPEYGLIAGGVSQHPWP